MSEHNGDLILPQEQQVLQETPGTADVDKSLYAQLSKMIPIIFGLPGDDPAARRGWLLNQVKRLVKNPGQFSGDFWDSLFGTGGDGISRKEDTEREGKIAFSMELPEPVRMPAGYSVAFHRADGEKDIITLLERDEEGNIHWLDAGEETVFVRTEDGFRRYPVQAGQGFGEWDGVLLSARSVRAMTAHFWNCADQTFLKWLGMEPVEETVYLGRPCHLCHAQPGTITFTYQCDMVIDDETGICLCYTADKLLKGAVFDIKEDGGISISIGEYSLGGAEMSFYCSRFRTEGVSFDTPSV